MKQNAPMAACPDIPNCVSSESGHYDLGVNRRRIETLRKQLKIAELIR